MMMMMMPPLVIYFFVCCLFFSLICLWICLVFLDACGGRIECKEGELLKA